MTGQVFTLSWATLWRIFLFGLIVSILFAARDALGILFVSIVLSLGVHPLVSFLERHRIPRLVSTIFIFLVGAFIFGGILYLAVPVLVAEVVGFLGEFNETLQTILGISLPSTVIKGLSLNLSEVLTFLGTSNISIGVALSEIVSRVVLILATLVVSFYLSVEKHGTERLLKVILPTAYEEPVLQVFHKFKVKMSRWLGAQLALSFLIGVVVAFGLTVLGVRYALVLGLLAALFELVPIIGPVLAGLAAAIVALSVSPSLALYTLGFFVIIQQLENHILIPIIMGKTMKVHPVVVIVSLLAGGHIAGFIGIFLAVPIAVLAQEIFEHLAERKTRRAETP
ncbi:MAG: AI-2E family transporter [Candidatus Wolfebacteria bacterium]|nr:AI-2E family transporter [Candidatus Wolfebacteria bacterium]